MGEQAADPGGRPGHRTVAGAGGQRERTEDGLGQRSSKRGGRELPREAVWQKERQRQKFGEMET